MRCSEKQTIFLRPDLDRQWPIRLSKPRPLYAKKSSRKSWVLFALFLLLSAVVFVKLTHASPPINRGARPLAVGAGYTAVAGDSYSLYYNPAGLSEVNQKELVFDYGRFDSEREVTGTEFNGIYTFP